MAAKIDIDTTRATLSEFHQGLNTLFNQIRSDHERGQVCTNYPDFIREAPAAYLTRAQERMAKKNYRIGVAGAFSAGKSTLVNSLLGDPDLLPVQAGECTMSITVVTAPKPGEGEHVKAAYFSEEDAMRYIFNNQRYKHLLVDYVQDVMNPTFNKEKAIMAIKSAAQKAGEDPHQRSKKAELLEFLEALELYKERLGTVWADDIQKAPMYLTTDSEDRGMGHLLLIEQVWVHQSNDLFSKDGFEIIDLPGTDSTNDRQRELTHSYLSEADAVLNIIQSKGMAEADMRILEEMGRYNNEVKNKMFLVMNMFDKLALNEIGKDDIHRLVSKQVLGRIIDFGLDPEKFYLTSAKYQDLQNRKDKGVITNHELKELENIMTDCNAKLNALDPDIEPRVRKLMEQCYKDGGVMALKRRMMEYLKYDIQVERLREVYTDLNRVFRAAKKLLDGDRDKIRELVEEGMRVSKGEQVTLFFEETKNAFFDKVNMISRAVEPVSKAMMEKIRDQLAKAFTVFIDKYNIDRATRKLVVKVPRDIKLTVIDNLKPTLSQKFAETIRDMLPRAIINKLFEQVESSRVGLVLDKLSDDLRTDWHDRFREMTRDFEQDMAHFSYMRALEETWHIQDSPIQVPPGGAQWSEEEEAKFKEDLKSLFVRTFIEYAQKLEKILGRHYKVLVDRLIDDFELLVDEAATVIRRDPDRVTLPVEMLSGEESDDEQARIDRSLLLYHRSMEDLQRIQQQLDESLNSRN